MRMDGLRLLPVLGALALAGCGGGGGGGGMSPTPSPPAPTYTPLANVTGVNTWTTTAADYRFDRVNNSPTPTLSSSSASVTIAYDAASKTYTLTGALPSTATAPTTASYGPAAADSTPGSYGNGAFSVGTGVQYTYVNWGSWRQAANQGNDQHFGVATFTYGSQTQTGDMPTTGTGTYAVQMVVPDFNMGGTGTITANFANGTINTSLSPYYVYGGAQYDPNHTPFTTWTGTGVINSSERSFTSTLASPGYSGSMSGQFYGPQAAEIGATFQVKNTSSGDPAAVGVIIGKR